MEYFSGTVTQSTGSWYKVLNKAGIEIDARLKGKFRLDGKSLTNPIAVGDEVLVELENEVQGVIYEIKPRRNYLIRKSTKLSSRYQMVAANIDLAVVIATLAKPRTSPGFIDRFLVTCESFGIEAAIVFNKTDLLNAEQIGDLKTQVELYRAMNYRVFTTSFLSGKLNSDLREALMQGTSLLFGHSGVGKSTLINILLPGSNQQVAEISHYHGKGKHTTTYARMLAQSPMLRIIDTPGVKEFGMETMETWKIGHYFRDLRPLVQSCRFNNCLHVEEPYCAVLAALEEGKISLQRYESYLSILGEIQAI